MNWFVRIREAVALVSPLRFFIATAAVFGAAFIILVPPFQGGDEPLHFYRAYQVSELNLVVDRNIGNDSGGVIPTSLTETVLLTTHNSSLGNLASDQKYFHGTTAKAFSIRENPDEKVWTNFTATALYPPVAYMPQAAGILVGRVLDMPPIVMMYLGRVANLATWIALIALSIKLMPRKKWAVAFIGLLPVALSQAASLSADVMTIGTFAVFLSTVFYWRASKQRAAPWQLAGFLAVCGIMVLCKQIMVVFLPLVLLIQSGTFASKKIANAAKAAFLLVPMLLYGVWQMLIKDVDMKSVFSHHQDPAAQVSFVVHHPLHFLVTLWNTHFFAYGDSITRSFIGTFGWGDPSLSVLLITVGYIGLFLALVANTEKRVEDWLGGGQKLLLAAVGLGYAVAVSAALYAYYNPVGASTIAGIQGRYLLPLALLAVPLLYSGWLKTSERSYRFIVTLIPLLLLAASLITIYYRYYAA